MLQHITVQNFALIKDLQLQPQAGLNVITGETGAGKSILLGALGLVLGNRAETSALLNKDLKCIIEAVFDIKNLDLQAFFDTHELDYSEQTILRREIAPGGKSRAFVNDTPVMLNVMKELGEQLIEIHTQNTGLLITSGAEQLNIVDDFAGHQNLLNSYKKNWKKYHALGAELEEFKRQTDAAQKEKDFLQFQFDELENFNPVAGEETQLEQLAMTLSHAEEITAACNSAEYTLAEEEGSVLDQIGVVRSNLKNAAQLNPEIEQAVKRLEGVGFELKDIAATLRQTSAGIDNDAARLETVNERIAKLQLLLKKHQLKSSAELAELKNQIELRLLATEQAGTKAEQLEAAVDAAKKVCEKEATQLHESRLKAAKILCKESTLLIKDLGIPAGKVDVSMALDLENLNASGGSKIKLLFAANPGQEPQALEKVASGGEVSRLNFCFKSLLAGKKAMPTLIFDEADTGVSGEVAGKMGSMMHKLGEKHQVIAITHLPQVAAAGETHFFVYKNLSASSANTEIRLLQKDERVKNIAQMLSGKDPGEAAVANARELLKSLA